MLLYYYDFLVTRLYKICLDRSEKFKAWITHFPLVSGPRMSWVIRDRLCCVHIRGCSCGCKHSLILLGSVMSCHALYWYVLLYCLLTKSLWFNIYNVHEIDMSLSVVLWLTFSMKIDISNKDGFSYGESSNTYLATSVPNYKSLWLFYVLLVNCRCIATINEHNMLVLDVVLLVFCLMKYMPMHVLEKMLFFLEVMPLLGRNGRF